MWFAIVYTFETLANCGTLLNNEEELPAPRTKELRFEAGQRHGQGKWSGANGDVYDGSWVLACDTVTTQRNPVMDVPWTCHCDDPTKPCHGPFIAEGRFHCPAALVTWLAGPESFCLHAMVCDFGERQTTRSMVTVYI
eukprot:1927762-Amphidinium_carterae.1